MVLMVLAQPSEQNDLQNVLLPPPKNITVHSHSHMLSFSVDILVKIHKGSMNAHPGLNLHRSNILTYRIMFFMQV
jgi:hypothetical protein